MVVLVAGPESQWVAVAVEIKKCGEIFVFTYKCLTFAHCIPKTRFTMWNENRFICPKEHAHNLLHLLVQYLDGSYLSSRSTHITSVHFLIFDDALPS